jgi:hypothetical protein
LAQYNAHAKLVVFSLLCQLFVEKVDDKPIRRRTVSLRGRHPAPGCGAEPSSNYLITQASKVAWVL